VIAAYDNLSTVDGAFSDEDRRLAETFAARAAIAVELSERVEQDVALRMVAAQEGERRRLARELHDETGQTLTSMLIGLKALEETVSPEARGMVAGLRSSVVSSLRGVRRIVVELRPKALDDLGLVAALERLATSVSEETGLSVAFKTEPFAHRLPSEIESALYRIVQEGLTNVVKHAQARHASVFLASSGETVLLVLEDDGLGFDLAATPERGFGLEGMRERVQLLGGRLEITSRDGEGTSVLAEVPVP
jgi:signal transduction histidine kinase